MKLNANGESMRKSGIFCSSATGLGRKKEKFTAVRAEHTMFSITFRRLFHSAVSVATSKRCRDSDRVITSFSYLMQFAFYHIFQPLFSLSIFISLSLPPPLSLHPSSGRIVERTHSLSSVPFIPFFQLLFAHFACLLCALRSRFKWLLVNRFHNNRYQQ